MTILILRIPCSTRCCFWKVNWPLSFIVVLPADNHDPKNLETSYEMREYEFPSLRTRKLQTSVSAPPFKAEAFRRFAFSIKYSLFSLRDYHVFKNMYTQVLCWTKCQVRNTVEDFNINLLEIITNTTNNFAGIG